MNEQLTCHEYHGKVHKSKLIYCNDCIEECRKYGNNVCPINDHSCCEYSFDSYLNSKIMDLNCKCQYKELLELKSPFSKFQPGLCKWQGKLRDLGTFAHARLLLEFKNM